MMELLIVLYRMMLYHAVFKATPGLRSPEDVCVL
jgi:hypothetical protein